MPADVEFIASSFGGGWLVAKNDEAARDMTYLVGEPAAPLMPLCGEEGWIIEPADVADTLTHFRDAGFSVSVQ